jgi:hypothetical protein
MRSCGFVLLSRLAFIKEAAMAIDLLGNDGRTAQLKKKRLKQASR